MLTSLQYFIAEQGLEESDFDVREDNELLAACRIVLAVESPEVPGQIDTA